jgi:hypothetical protein
VRVFRDFLRPRYRNLESLRRIGDGAPRALLSGMRDDIEARIEQLKRDIEEASGEKPFFGRAPDCPPEVEEIFLKQVLACELKEKKRRKTSRT